MAGASSAKGSVQIASSADVPPPEVHEVSTRPFDDLIATEAANPPPTNDELRAHIGWLEKADLSSNVSEMELDNVFRGVTAVLFDGERQNPVVLQRLRLQGRRRAEAGHRL